MRKLIDTLVLILLLLGPAVVLTCANQDEPAVKEQLAEVHEKQIEHKAIANLSMVRP